MLGFEGRATAKTVDGGVDVEGLVVDVADVVVELEGFVVTGAVVDVPVTTS